MRHDCGWVRFYCGLIRMQRLVVAISHRSASRSVDRIGTEEKREGSHGRGAFLRPFSIKPKHRQVRKTCSQCHHRWYLFDAEHQNTAHGKTPDTCTRIESYHYARTFVFSRKSLLLLFSHYLTSEILTFWSQDRLHRDWSRRIPYSIRARYTPLYLTRNISHYHAITPPPPARYNCCRHRRQPSMREAQRLAHVKPVKRPLNVTPLVMILIAPPPLQIGHGLFTLSCQSLM